MKVHYDAEVDAVYIKLGSQKPDGVVEISEMEHWLKDRNKGQSVNTAERSARPVTHDVPTLIMGVYAWTCGSTLTSRIGITFSAIR